MYTGLLHTHSTLRYAVILLIVIVVAKSLIGWLNKQPYTKLDNKLTLWMMIATHSQFLIGIILYFVSPFVQFGPNTMKDAGTRYWTVEHITAMVLAVALVTVARSSSKKLTNDLAKHRRVFILTTIAFLLIVGVLSFSGRGILIPVY